MEQNKKEVVFDGKDLIFNVDDIERYVRHVSDRNDIVYINQLSELQRLLIREE